MHQASYATSTAGLDAAARATITQAEADAIAQVDVMVSNDCWTKQWEPGSSNTTGSGPNLGISYLRSKRAHEAAHGELDDLPGV